MINNEKLLIPPILSFLSTFQHLYGSSTCGIAYILYDSLFLGIQNSDKALADNFHSLIRTILFNTPFSLKFAISLLNTSKTIQPSANCIKYIIEYIEIIGTFPSASIQFGVKYITNALVNLLPKAKGIDKCRIQEQLLQYSDSNPSLSFSQVSISSTISSSSSYSSGFSEAEQSVNTPSQSQSQSQSQSPLKEDGCLWFFFGSLLFCACTILLLLFNLSPVSLLSRRKHHQQQVSPNFDATTVLLSNANHHSTIEEVVVPPEDGFDFVVTKDGVKERRHHEQLVKQRQEYDIIYLDGFETSSSTSSTSSSSSSSSYHSSEIIMGDGWIEETNDSPSSHVIELSMGESYSASHPSSNAESSTNLLLVCIVISVIIGGFMLRSVTTGMHIRRNKPNNLEMTNLPTQQASTHRKNACIDFDKLDMSSVEQGEDSML